jgi:general nucleoside transport system permease protein
VGGLAATALAVGFPTVSGWVLLPACLLVATLAGAIWGGIPGVLKARMGVNEILSTVMMNAIALQLANYLLRGPMIDPDEIERGTRIAQSALTTCTSLVTTPHTAYIACIPALFWQLILAILVYIFLWRTTTGYRIRAVGLNAIASRYAGYKSTCLTRPWPSFWAGRSLGWLAVSKWSESNIEW